MKAACNGVVRAALNRTGASCVAVVAALMVSQAALAQKTVPLRTLSAADAASAPAFGRIINVRTLGDGTVLVNDGGRRQLVALNAALGNPLVVLDSATTTMGYGRAPAMLVPYHGDSLLLISNLGRSLIDPAGAVISWVPVKSMPLLSTIRGSSIGVDSAENYVYRTSTGPRPQNSSNASGPTPPATTSSYLSTAPTTPSAGSLPGMALIVRGNFATRKVQGVASVRAEPGAGASDSKTEDGRMLITTIVNVLPRLDGYAVLADGTLAVVRDDDYHVDFYRPNGTLESTPQIPFAFRQLTIADRQALIDSARAAQAKAEAAGIMTMERQLASMTAGFSVAKSGGLVNSKPGTGFSVNVVRADSVVAGAVAANPGQSNSGVATVYAARAADLLYVPATDLPARYPAFRVNGIIVDESRNLWIPTTATGASEKGEIIYDVVNDHGLLVQRVRVPAEKSVVGFGPGGMVYLAHNVDTVWILERTKLMQ